MKKFAIAIAAAALVAFPACSQNSQGNAANSQADNNSAAGGETAKPADAEASNEAAEPANSAKPAATEDAPTDNQAAGDKPAANSTTENPS
jgi:hypothetical protein